MQDFCRGSANVTVHGSSRVTGWDRVAVRVLVNRTSMFGHWNAVSGSSMCWMTSNSSETAGSQKCKM